MMLNKNYRPLTLILIASLFPFFAFLQMDILNVLGRQVGQEMLLKPSDISFLSACYLYANAIMLLPVGILLDRFRIKYLISGAISLMISGILIFSTSHHLFLLSIARFIEGAGHAFALLSCFRLVNIYAPTNRQGFMMGLVLTIAFLGGLVAQFPIELLMQHLGWRSTLLIQAGFGILIGLLIIFVIPTGKRIVLQKKQFWIGLKIIYKNKYNWLAGFYTSLMGTPLMILGALWGSNYLMNTYLLNSSQAASITSMIFIGSILGGPLVGFVSDRLRSRKFIMLVGAILTFLTISIVYQWHAASFIQLIMLFFLIGLFGSVQVLGYPFIAENNHKTVVSTGMGFVNVLIVAVIASSQLVFGYLWNSSTTQTYALYFILLCVAASVFIAFKLKDQLPFLNAQKK